MVGLDKIYIYLFIIINISLFSQNKVADYVKLNSLPLKNNSTKQQFVNLGLFNYQAYFFGEDHVSELTPYKEIYFLNLLKNKIKNVFIEFPVGYRSPYEELMKINPIDTTAVDFEFYAGKNKNQEVLLRYFYRENQNELIKFNFLPIDIILINQFNADNMLYFFKKRLKPKKIKEDFHYLQKLKKDDIKDEDYLLNGYLLLRENFYSNLAIYEIYLKKDFIEMKKNLDGIYAYSIAKKEDSICACRSNAREDFMLKNIMDEITSNDINDFISINGVFHIPLTLQENWELIDEWESLATRFKKQNAKFNVCSIYFMERKEDNFDNKYFPDEKKLILENTVPDETYLIRLDGENTPFKELSEKFQYIVVW